VLVVTETEEEREEARAGTVPERLAYVAARRERASARDGARFRLAEELRGPTKAVMRREQGYAVVPPGTLPGVDAVVDAANELIDSIGHEDLMSGKRASTKGGFVARKLLSPETLTLDSPYLRLALDEALVAPVAEYLGLVPLLHQVDVWYSAHASSQPKASQKWHMDHDDTTQVRVWIHCNDVGPESGPLTVVDATTSARVAEQLGYSIGGSYRIPAERIAELVPQEQVSTLSGPRGTTVLLDACRCFHYGSRVGEGAPPRRMVLIDYMTPYSFNYGDHCAEAPYRHLAGAGASELQTLVLGAA
jgi:hypothetical protein